MNDKELLNELCNDAVEVYALIFDERLDGLTIIPEFEISTIKDCIITLKLLNARYTKLLDESK